jgi:hypothetical protein
VNAVSRRYEAEADWRALRATTTPPRDPLFRNFAREPQEPNLPLLDYLWLENHPTRPRAVARAPSRGGCPGGLELAGPDALDGRVLRPRVGASSAPSRTAGMLIRATVTRHSPSFDLV